MSNMDALEVTKASSEDVQTTDYLKHIILDFMQMQEFVKEPFILNKADGIRYEDVNGKSYIDGISGIFVATLGHNNRRVIDAMKDQLDQMSFAPPLHGTNPPAVKLAKLLSEITPGDLNTIKLLSGGSEATETAMKLARQYHKQSGNPTKFKVISRYMGYHGGTFGSLSATGNARRKSMFEPFPPGFLHVYPPLCYRCPYEKTYPECETFCARTIRDIIELEGPDTVSAIIVEPISNTGGIITPPQEYHTILREICDEFNILLIFDEIITGFGRTGEMFAAETFKTTPDILCMGKGMSSGYAPLAGVAISDRVAKAFWGKEEDQVEFSHGHTYSGNPLSAAAGLACIQEIIERDLPGNARAMGSYLRNKLEEGLGRFGIAGDVRGKGLLLGVELVRDPETKEAFGPQEKIGVKIGKQALKNGLITRFDPDWFALAPPLVVDEGDIDEMMDILLKSVEEVMKTVK